MKCDSHISLRPDPSGNWPEVHPTAYIDAAAQIIGAVHIGAGVFVGPGVVVRADETDAQGKVTSIVIGPECNIQDGVIIHAFGGTSPADQMFMEKVVASNLALAEGHNRLNQCGF